MIDNADLQLARRKTRDRSVALLVLGIVLLMPPMVRIAQIDTTVFGLPFALVYLFAAWGLLVIGAALLARPLRDSEKPIASATSDDTTG
ncbi:MAG: hypothetical protein JJ900_03025 [Rhodospirillales bacterium]|nr:hypothetical protein [Rhodospirillales bacterium]MBO6785796.1 hypothetical protein [Rhodospirillales bacterium]